MRTEEMLVLPSVLPEPEMMVAEMRRVTRPGGVVAAAFWDSPGGNPGQRMLRASAAIEGRAQQRDCAQHARVQKDQRNKHQIRAQPTQRMSDLGVVAHDGELARSRIRNASPTT